MLLFNIFLSSKNSSTSRKGKTSVIKLLHIFKCHLFTQLFVQHITVFYFYFWLEEKGKYIPEVHLVINLPVTSQEKIFTGSEITVDSQGTLR